MSRRGYTTEADVLRRGLAFSRREKGADHEETLAHLAALAVHLENAGKHTEAAELKREHDDLAARVEANLRRRLAHCRQTKGDDESTLDHLTALAAHLEKIGKPAEAAEYRREHDEIAARVAAKKKEKQAGS